MPFVSKKSYPTLIAPTYNNYKVAWKYDVIITYTLTFIAFNYRFGILCKYHPALQQQKPYSHQMFTGEIS